MKETNSVFENQKKKYLTELEENEKGKKDKSRAGFLDREIKPIVDKINKQKDYFTTSSCAGRIIIMTEPKSGKKYDTKWLFSSHEQINFKAIEGAIDNISSETKETIWFKMESPILHVCCRDIESAGSLLKKVKTTGLKRSGINTFGKRTIVEIMSSEKIDVPIADNGKLLVDKEYIRFLIDEANKKLEKSRNKINKLEELI